MKKVGDVTLEFDNDGFLVNPEIWNIEVACSIALDEGIMELTEDHWKVVRYIRDYWRDNDIAPTVRMLCKESGIPLREIYKLFKSGPARGACRIAGLPKPDGCV